MSLTVNSLWGYNDNGDAQQNGALETFAPHEPGYTGFLSAAPRYRVGKQRHSFELGGRAYLNSLSNLGLVPSYGSEVYARLNTTLGQRHQMRVSQTASSMPFYVLGGFGPLQAEIAGGLPNSNPSNGYAFRRSWTNNSAVSLTSRWTPRNILAFSYSHDLHDFRDGIGDTRSHQGFVDYTVGLGRRSSLRTMYRHGSMTQSQLGITRPITEDAAEFGYQYDRTYRQGRRWLLGFGAGATYVKTLGAQTSQPLAYTVPSGYGRTQFDIGGTWSIRADFRRAVSVLDGVSAQPFVTDAATTGIGGFMGSRTEMVLSGAYSRGGPPTGLEGEHKSYGATIQMRFMLTRLLSTVVSHTYYAYRLRGVTGLPAGFPDRMNRQAVRIGMTLQLPLYGPNTGRPSRGNEPS